MQATRRCQLVMIVAGLVERARLARRVVARLLGRAESTVRSWCAVGARLLAGLAAPRPGRPARLADRLQRNDILSAIHAAAGRLGVRELKEAYPDVGRAHLADLLRRCRRVQRKARRRGLAVLQWGRPGAVWAMDFTEVRGGVEDLGRHVLVVRDLGSGKSLAAVPCHSQDAVSVIAVLEVLIAEHGPPLVLKADNGSAFLAGPTQRLLDAHGVLVLFSPPGTPSYNGSCEAGCGSVKHRAERLAALRGPGIGVRIDELEAARAQADAQPAARRAGAPSREQVWRQRAPLGDDLRHELHRRVTAWRRRLRRERGIAPDDYQPHAVRASIDRFAIGRALRELQLLTIRRRDFGCS